MKPEIPFLLKKLQNSLSPCNFVYEQLAFNQPSKNNMVFDLSFYFKTFKLGQNLTTAFWILGCAIFIFLLLFLFLNICLILQIEESQAYCFYAVEQVEFKHETKLGFLHWTSTSFIPYNKTENQHIDAAIIKDFGLSHEFESGSQASTYFISCLYSFFGLNLGKI